MAEMLKLADQFEVLSEAERQPTPVRVLKGGDSFAVFDPHGDVVPTPSSEHGFFHAGTRFLSRFELVLANYRPLLLSSTVSEDNTVFTADLTNPDVMQAGERVGRGLVHVFRSRVISHGTWIECLRVTNHAAHPIETPFTIRFDADFADIFEVRGTRRAARGQRLPSQSSSDLLTLRYRGLDGVERQTRIHSLRVPDHVDDQSFSYLVALEPHACAEIEISISCEVRGTSHTVGRYGETVADRRRQIDADREQSCQVHGSNPAFNRWARRSESDLRMMITNTGHGPYPYAGIPWFSTPFGRDGIITALEMLWAAPDVARGVLGFLAETQATSRNDAQDAQPGKILHEMRDGEMAALGEIPFGRYYGSADATPLFVVLAHAYYERTGDLPFVERLWPHILAALDWMATDGDPDKDGFIEYSRRSDTGLVQQGWKDSWDSIFHADGTLATPPIALCEIQGYAYAAWIGASRLAAARGDVSQAKRWKQRASTLQTKFEEAFWCDELGTYAIALDGSKKPCRVRSSNPGHCLYTGIASRPRASRVAQALLSEQSFAGWGIRTVAAGAARYNPMSYHNGSVWPHDNALVAAGFARYGFTSQASRIFTAMFDLSQAVDLHRLPELICGFHRRAGDAPTLYPVACAPQAWAAGAIYLLVQSCLGLRVDGVTQRVSFRHSKLPDELDWLRLSNLSVGNGNVDLLLTKHAHDVGVTVLRREGTVEIIDVK